MSEQESIERTLGVPSTIESIGANLSSLGVRPGMVLLVHSSLSSLGWVCGGAPSVIIALERTLGPDGTLVMPAMSGDLSEPSAWRNPPVPESWWPIIRENAPAFDIDMTPTRGLGAIPECFRKQRGTMRSNHPNTSFAARGPRARTILENHSLDHPHGERSPLARIFDLDGWVLLMGVGHDVNTSIHLAEHRTSLAETHRVKRGAPVIVDGRREWAVYDDIDFTDDDFSDIGASFASETGLVRTGQVGSASCSLMPQRALVDFAVNWIDENRIHRKS